MFVLTAAPALAQDTVGDEGLVAVFHLEGGADVMLSDTLDEQFGWGGHVGARFGLEVVGPLSIQVGFESLWFPVESQDPGNLYQIALGARGYFPVTDGALGGPWVDANAGIGITGELVRFVFDVGAGWDFFPHPKFGVGPYVRYMQIVQPNDEPLGTDARMLGFGVHLTARLGLQSPPAPVERIERVVEAPEDPDSDGDGMSDSRDACPSSAEDMDGVQDDDGCPERDADSDGIADEDDRCPELAESRNGFEDEDGCPDEAPAPEPIANPRERAGEPLEPTVRFRVGTDRVSPRFRAEIQAVCEVAAENPESIIRVIGHADEQGSAAANHRLGAQRAGAVAEQLVICGVSPTRLHSVSYGDTRPTCADDTVDCHLDNRRVHFELVR